MKRKDLDEGCVLIDENEVSDEPKPKHLKATPAMEEQGTEVKSNNEKYDRQIRLWGVDGQQDLENANICLLNVTAVGTEILKCLVLPGVGKFTIVDKSNITPEDLGSNFFLDSNFLESPKHNQRVNYYRN